MRREGGSEQDARLGIRVGELPTMPGHNPHLLGVKIEGAMKVQSRYQA